MSYTFVVDPSFSNCPTHCLVLLTVWTCTNNNLSQICWFFSIYFINCSTKIHIFFYWINMGLASYFNHQTFFRTHYISSITQVSHFSPGQISTATSQLSYSVHISPGQISTATQISQIFNVHFASPTQIFHVLIILSLYKTCIKIFLFHFSGYRFHFSGLHFHFSVL